MKLKRIPPDFVARYWEKVSPFLADAIEHSQDEFTLDQMKVYLIKGEWNLLGVFEGDEVFGALIIRFTNYPNYRMAIIIAMGGKGILDVQGNKDLEGYLKASGATRVRGYVRDSVARLSTKFGYKKVYNIVEKQI